MKLCPQCDFIYEDDQTVCDMDGQPLVFEPTLTAFPGTTPLKKSVALPPASSSGYPGYRRLAATALTGLALGATLVLFVYVFTQGVSSAEPAVAPTSSTNPVFPLSQKSASPALATPVAYGARPLAGEPRSAGFQSEPAGSTSNVEGPPHQHAVPPADGAVTGRIDTRTSGPQAAGANATPALSISSLPRVEPLPQLKPLPRLEAPKATRNASRASLKQKPARAQQKKESRFGSFLKKTAKILKKPFKN